MERRPPPNRFSEQIRLLKLKQGLGLGRTGSETEIRGSPSESRFVRKPHHSAPNLPVNPSGRFNSELQRTGFLGETKMRAKRIAQNPKRFLEAYADGRAQRDKDPDLEQEFVPTELPELEHFIQKLALDDRFEAKEAAMRTRTESAKFRSFLLAMTSTSSMEVDPKTLAFLQSYTAGGDELRSTSDGDTIYAEAETMENLVTNYLEKVRTIDTGPIQAWIAEFIDMADLELPHGLPTNVPTQLPSGSGEFGDCKEIVGFIESAQDNFLLLDGEYHTKVEEITKELRTNYQLVTSRDWTNKDSSLLFYVVNSFKATGPGGADSLAALPLQLELMHRLFPGKSQGDISKQKFRLKAKKGLEEKRGAVIRTWIRDKAELQFKMDVAWKEISKRRLAEMERKVSLKKQKELCDFWAERLQKLRQEKCEQVKKLRTMVEPLEKYVENKTKSIAESEAQRRDAAKMELKKYQLQKTEEEARVMAEQEMERSLEQEALKERLRTTKKRVTLRESQRKMKEKAKRDVEAALAEQRRLRKLQLERTKEPVEIDYDPANVVAETHASMIRRFSTVKDKKRVEDEKMASIFRDSYSFSAESVLKDRRLRFQAKLKEAGLMDSAYARQVLMAMEPQPKPHLQSQVKFSQDDL